MNGALLGLSMCASLMCGDNIVSHNVKMNDDLYLTLVGATDQVDSYDFDSLDKYFSQVDVYGFGIFYSSLSANQKKKFLDVFKKSGFDTSDPGMSGIRNSFPPIKIGKDGFFMNSVSDLKSVRIFFPKGVFMDIDSYIKEFEKVNLK